MIKNDIELEGTLERIQHFTNIVLNMRKVEKTLSTYEASAGGFLAEIAKMNLEVNEYLSFHPIRLEQEREKIAA